MLHLRLLLGRPARRPPARPAAVRAVRGLGRVRQGRSDQAAGGAARPPPRAGRAVRRAHLRRAAPPLPVAVLAGAAGLGRLRGARPVLVRPRARRAGRGLRHRGAVVAGVRRDRRVRADPHRRGHGAREVLAARLARTSSSPASRAAATTRCARGSSPTRTGATASGGRTTRPPSSRCSRAPTGRARPGTSSPATRSARRASRSSRRCAAPSSRSSRPEATTWSCRRRS